MLSVTIKVLIMSRRIACFIYATFISNGCPNADVFNAEVLASFCFSTYKQQNGPLYLTLVYRCLEIVINYGNLHPVSLGQEHFAQSYTVTEKFYVNIHGVIRLGCNSNHATYLCRCHLQIWYHLRYIICFYPQKSFYSGFIWKPWCEIYDVILQKPV